MWLALLVTDLEIASMTGSELGVSMATNMSGAL